MVLTVAAVVEPQTKITGSRDTPLFVSDRKGYTIEAEVRMRVLSVLPLEHECRILEKSHALVDMEKASSKMCRWKLILVITRPVVLERRTKLTRSGEIPAFFPEVTGSDTEHRNCLSMLLAQTPERR